MHDSSRKTTRHRETSGLGSTHTNCLNDCAIVVAIGGFESHIGTVGAITTQVTTPTIEILPTRLRKLRSMRHRPDALGNIIITRPGFLSQHQSVACEWQRWIPGSNQAPVDVSSHLPCNIVTIEVVGERSSAFIVPL